ncbi:MAG: phosphotransacetylase family protein [Aphanocapsa feldmannii 288cV]|nr:MAG: phosphotransacetylase family protein [Aphanocapsa feldmannii 288cV]
MGLTVLVGSAEPYSGKSALALGLCRLLRESGRSVRLGKPLATSLEGPDAVLPCLDDDVRFVGGIIGLPAAALLPSLASLAAPLAAEQLAHRDPRPTWLLEELAGRLDDGYDGVTVLEGAGSMSEGRLFGLHLPRLAERLDASVLLAHPWEGPRSVDALLDAQDRLDGRLAGIVLNAVDPTLIPGLEAKELPSLEALALPILGILPRSPLLRSVTVAELAHRLEAEVLCCHDRLNLLVETLSIGAMNVNSAMEFFRQRRNMAVVTGADRTDIQLAALEASTQCLILTGAGRPLPQLVSRAEELEVPLLKVGSDTLTTVKVIEQAIGNVRIHEGVKATFALRLVEQNCDFSPLLQRLQQTPA